MASTSSAHTCIQRGLSKHQFSRHDRNKGLRHAWVALAGSPSCSWRPLGVVRIEKRPVPLPENSKNTKVVVPLWGAMGATATRVAHSHPGPSHLPPRRTHPLKLISGRHHGIQGAQRVRDGAQGAGPCHKELVKHVQATRQLAVELRLCLGPRGLVHALRDTNADPHQRRTNGY